MTPETLEAVTRVARNDLATARRRQVNLYGTKRGLVEITHETGVYKLFAAPTHEACLAGDYEKKLIVCGPPRVVIPVLAQLYTVVEAA